MSADEMKRNRSGIHGRVGQEIDQQQSNPGVVPRFTPILRVRISESVL